MAIVALLIGLVAGAAGVYAVAVRRALADRDRAALEAREAQRALAETEGALAAERGAFDTRVENAIKALSTEALRENANTFTEQAMGRLGEYVEPLKKSLEKVETNVNLLEQQRQRAYGEIHKELEIVRLTQRGASRRRRAISSTPCAGESHTRGRWGEIQLRRVIEMAGMLSYCDFDEQQSIEGDDGRQLRPDVIVKLPGGKSIVIDSKVSLSRVPPRHEEGADEETRRAGHGRPRPAGARPHPALGQKAYWRQLPATPEFVVMFLHDESSLARGTRRRPDAARARALEQRDPGLADEPDRPAARRALRLAAGDDRRGRPPDQRPRPRAVQAPLDDGRARLEARPVARRGRQVLQRDRRIARAAGSAAGAPLRAARDHGHRAARADPDRASDAGAERTRSSSATTCRSPLEILAADASAA